MARFRERYQELITQYGLLATATYLGTSVVVGVPTFVSIQFGYGAETTAEQGGTFLATWLVLKATQIPRVFVTLALVPFIARYALKREDEPVLANEGEVAPEAVDSP